MGSEHRFSSLAFDEQPEESIILKVLFITICDHSNTPPALFTQVIPKLFSKSTKALSFGSESGLPRHKFKQKTELLNEQV